MEEFIKIGVNESKIERRGGSDIGEDKRGTHHHHFDNFVETNEFIIYLRK